MCFGAKILDESRIQNANETHFVFIMDYENTFGFKGDKDVKYVDVASGEEAKSMLIRMTGGVDARTEVPMLIFKNRNRSYPAQGLVDNVTWVWYRSGAKG